jgi:hypothetical protein
VSLVVELSARQRGDFQTPEELARQVWATIDCSQFDLIIEPTFGLGSFLITKPDCSGGVIGWEIDKDYYQSTIEKVSEAKLVLKDVFTVTSSDVPATPDSSVLVIGNPPWVTNAEQSVLGGRNTGTKQNLKSLNGFDALTGKSNFDISEAIILRFVRILKDCRFVQFAILSKFSVLRNLILFLSDSRIGNFEYHKIDSARYFDASVDAGLIKFTISDSVHSHTCKIYKGINGEKVGEIGLINKRLVYDIAAYKRISFMEHRGERSYIWRQGVKHNLKGVLELIETDGKIRNQLGEIIDIEPESLYHLYKSSDIFHGRKSRYVIPIYQHDLKDTLKDLPNRYPKLFTYLSKHKDKFLARKSSIFKNKPMFTIFGIGEYTHSTYKIAIGGMYSDVAFQLLEPGLRPAIVDDTSYILSTNNREEAIYLYAVVSLDCAREFLLSISYESDKRRFSKDVLARLLLPPIKECPQELLSGLVFSWSQDKSFSAADKEKLKVWLIEYKANDKPAIQGDLF